MSPDDLPNLELPTVEDSKVLFEGFGQLRCDQLRLPNQQLYDYYTYVTSAEAVMVVATTREGKIVVNREYRHPTSQVLLGLPGGLLDPGEDVLTGAERELMEETGYSAESFHLIGNAFPFPGASSQKSCFVHANGAHRVADPALEAAEILHSVELSEKRLLSWIADGHPVDGALCMALYFFDRKGCI
ncbi:MAG: NUDIX hydrolase [Chlamydiia bacterium]|nr:NUDIX hydrolase [Chlamydiia bacterium]